MTPVSAMVSIKFSRGKFSRPATGYECIAHAPAFDRGVGSATVCLWTGTKKGHFSFEGTFFNQSYFELGFISGRSRGGAQGTPPYF